MCLCKETKEQKSLYMYIFNLKLNYHLLWKVYMVNNLTFPWYWSADEKHSNTLVGILEIKKVLFLLRYLPDLVNILEVNTYVTFKIFTGTINVLICELFSS